MRDRVYRISDLEAWAQAEQTGALPLSALDRRDGFVHLSSATQVRDTLRRFFTGREDLTLLTVSTNRLVDGSLRYEAPSAPDAELSPAGSRELFPHFYGQVPLDAIIGADPLVLDAPGVHRLPRAVARAIEIEHDDFATIEMRVVWDIEREIVVIEYPRPTAIEDEAGIYAWEATIERLLGPLVERRGGKVPALIGIDNLQVAPALTRHYAELADKVVSRWFSAVARWGERAASRRFFDRVNDQHTFDGGQVFATREAALSQLLG